MILVGVDTFGYYLLINTHFIIYYLLFIISLFNYLLFINKYSLLLLLFIINKTIFGYFRVDNFFGLTSTN